MEPREPKPKPAPQPQVEGGEKDAEAPEAAPEATGGMIGEGGVTPGESDREGGMIGQG